MSADQRLKLIRCCVVLAVAVAAQPVPDFDANRIAMFLLDPHPKMPDMSLTRFEAGDLAAYIATLRR
jgi:hypothetical protein